MPDSNARLYQKDPNDDFEALASKDRKLYSPSRILKMPETANPRCPDSNCRLLLALLAAIAPIAISCTNSSGPNPITFQITSGSMAPTFWGPSCQASCQSCGRHWRISAETASPNKTYLCDLCGGEVSVDSRVQPGDIVSAVPTVGSYSPARFDCIAFGTSNNTTGENSNENGSNSTKPTWNCKRVWGLPGENLQFSLGELYVNGNLFQKDYAQLRQVMSEVCRLDPQGIAQDLCSWQFIDPQGNRSTISLDDNRLMLHPAQTLQFHHVSVLDPQQSAVFDDYPQDLSTPRNLKEVDDLIFDFELELDSQDLNWNSTEIQLQLDYLGNCYLHRFKPSISPEPITTTEPDRKQALKTRFTIAAWDRQVAVVTSDLLTHSETTTTSNPKLTTTIIKPTDATLNSSNKTSLRLACSHRCTVSTANVFRDIYLRMSDRESIKDETQKITVPANHYFVVGDNLPISLDSRNGLGTVDRGQIKAILTAP